MIFEIAAGIVLGVLALAAIPYLLAGILIAALWIEPYARTIGVTIAILLGFLIFDIVGPMMDRAGYGRNYVVDTTNPSGSVSPLKGTPDGQEHFRGEAFSR